MRKIDGDKVIKEINSFIDMVSDLSGAHVFEIEREIYLLRDELKEFITDIKGGEFNVKED